MLFTKQAANRLYSETFAVYLKKPMIFDKYGIHLIALNSGICHLHVNGLHFVVIATSDSYKGLLHSTSQSKHKRGSEKLHFTSKLYSVSELRAPGTVEVSILYDLSY